MHARQASPLDAYARRWHVVASNFPIWLKGDRTRPTFNYRVIQDAAGAALDDRVVYARRGRERQIADISRPQDAAAIRLARACTFPRTT